MAEKKREPRDSMAERLGQTEGHGPAAQPGLSLPAGMTLEQALAALAQSQVTTNAALAQIAADRERFLSLERAEIEKVERIRAEVEKTCQQRTQEAADRRWPAGQGRFHVALLESRLAPDPLRPGRQSKQLVPDGAFPEVAIWADSPEEARERYRIICGIRSTEQEIRALPLATGSEPAQAPAVAPPRWDEVDNPLDNPAARRELEAAGCAPL